MAQILVVDDEPDTRDLLAEWLRLRGHEAIAARDGLEALRVAAAERPACVLLNARMTSTDALEICRLLRSQSETSRVPVILIDGTNADSALMQGVLAGAHAALTQPIRLDELGRRIQALIGGNLGAEERPLALAAEAARWALMALPCDAVWLARVSPDLRRAAILGYADRRANGALKTRSFDLTENDWLGQVAVTGIAALNRPFDEIAVALDPIYQTLRDWPSPRVSVFPARGAGGALGLIALASSADLDPQAEPIQRGLAALIQQARVALEVERWPSPPTYSEFEYQTPAGTDRAGQPVTSIFETETLPPGEVEIGKDLPVSALSDALDQFGEEPIEPISAGPNAPETAVWPPAAIASLREAAQAAQTEALDAALARILSETARGVNARQTALALRLEAGGATLSITAAAGLRAARLEGMSLPIEGTLAGRAVESGELQSSEDGLPDAAAELFGEALQAPVDSALAAPIYARGEMAGALLAIHRRDGSFDEQDADTLRAMAGLAGLAIDRARLRLDLEKRLNELRQLRGAAPAESEDVTPQEWVGALAASDEITPKDELPIAAVSALEMARKTRPKGPSILKAPPSPPAAPAAKPQAAAPQALVRALARLEDTATMVVEATASRAAEAGVTIETLVADSLPPVSIDRGRMAVAFKHLVENAIGRSPRGGKVTVTIWDTGSTLQAEVADKGSAIPEAEQETIWERRAEIADSGGEGMGLAAVKQIVEQHGGTAWVNSKPGTGSAFLFSIPLAAPENGEFSPLF